MESYPVVREISSQKWTRALAKDANLQRLLKELEEQLVKYDIHMSVNDFVFGHENIIYAVSQLSDINERFGKGETILHWTVSLQGTFSTSSRWGQTGVLIVLLLGADPNVQDVLGRTPLHWAVNHDPLGIDDLDKTINTPSSLDILGNLRQEIPSQKTNSGNEDEKHTSRMISESLRIVLQLLHFKASPNVVDIYGTTPLCHAVWSKLDVIVDALLPVTDKSHTIEPGFLLSSLDDSKDIRPSHISKWIEGNTRDVETNKRSLRDLLCTAGTGLLHHPEEAEMQVQQVLTLFDRVSERIALKEPLFKFIPRLAGSMAEGTKCQQPDELDIVLHLVQFDNIVVPECLEYAPDGYVGLKPNGSEEDIKLYEKYMMDGYFDRDTILRRFMEMFEIEILNMKTWMGNEICNIYPTNDLCLGMAHAYTMGDIAAVRFVWHGKYYKQVEVSVDIVPAIFIQNWWPSSAPSEDPLGRPLKKEMMVILRAKIETYEYDYEEYGGFEDLTKLGSNEETVNGESVVKSFVNPGDIKWDDSECESSEYSFCSENSIDTEDEEQFFAQHLEQSSNTSGKNARVGEDRILSSGACADVLIDQSHDASKADANSCSSNERDSSEDNRDIQDDSSIEDQIDSLSDEEDDRGDIGFKLSYGRVENESLKSFPPNVKRAYILSKALVNFVPGIRAPNKSELNESIKGYTPHKDVFSYLLKNALFHVVQKFRDHTSLCKPGKLQGAPEQESSPKKQRCEETDVEIIYNRTDSKSVSEQVSDNDLKEIAFWVEKIFFEIESRARIGVMPAFFDTKQNLLEKIIVSGNQKSHLYPSLTYLIAHCNMIQNLVCLELPQTE